MAPTEHPEPRWQKTRTIAAVGVGLMSLLACAMYLLEWWRVVVGDGRAAYHFGSEAMLGHGGWQYSNPCLYAWTSLAASFAALVVGALLVIGLLSCRRSVLLIALFLLAVLALLWLVAAQTDWSRYASVSDQERYGAGLATSLWICWMARHGPA